MVLMDFFKRRKVKKELGRLESVLIECTKSKYIERFERVVEPKDIDWIEVKIDE